MKDHKTSATLLFIFVLTLIISGCVSSGPDPRATLPEGMSDQPSLQPNYSSLPPSEGSLWTDESDPFFEDTKARKPGDTLIVNIFENSQSSMDATTKADRTSTMDIGIPNFFGYMRQFEALPNPTSKGMLGDKIVGTKYKNSFEGDGKSNRNGYVRASVAARIIEVLPNGNYSIFGKRATKVNQEVQHIVVSGIVRPEDISYDNIVQSTSLADSRIEYYGQGVLADKQKQGWGTRLIDNVWPF